MKTANEIELLEALASMIEQYCGDKWGHCFMSAGEQAFEVLKKHDLIKNETAVGGEIAWEKLEEYKKQAEQ
jgi:hypothetical protein